MHAPAITRRRRPFLVPIWIIAGTGLLMVLVAAGLYWSATLTTVIVVRHAEEQRQAGADPPLSAAGQARAEELARILGEPAGGDRITAILVSDTRRAQQTAAPLAARLGIEPIVLPARPLDELLRAIRRERGRTVLVIGHSNTVPALVRRLAGRAMPDMEESEYDALYVLSLPTFGPHRVLRLRY